MLTITQYVSRLESRASTLENGWLDILQTIHYAVLYHGARSVAEQWSKRRVKLLDYTINEKNVQKWANAYAGLSHVEAYGSVLESVGLTPSELETLGKTVESLRLKASVLRSNLKRIKLGATEHATDSQKTAAEHSRLRVYRWAGRDMSASEEPRKRIIRVSEATFTKLEEQAAQVGLDMEALILGYMQAHVAPEPQPAAESTPAPEPEEEKPKPTTRRRTSSSRRAVQVNT